MKKLLALVLALVMTLGLATVGANAADFKDESSIEYEEAVNVMSGIGVIQGDDNGNFNPKGTLTREQAAKIVAYMMLGKSGADSLSASSAPFSDVAQDRWSAGAISYCATEGIIAGLGDGTFNPTGKLTGHQFAKMLLVALGYDPAFEGLVGADWAVNTAKLAVSAELENDLTVVLSQEITRDQAAMMAFNTLKADLVEYNGATNVKTNDGTEVTVNAKRDKSNHRTNVYDGRNINNEDKFCEVYFKDLKKSSSTNDFNEPVNKWTYKNETISEEAKAAEKVLTGALTYQDLFNAAGSAAMNKVHTLRVYVDGQQIGAFTAGGANATAKSNAKSDIILAETGATYWTKDNDEDLVWDVINGSGTAIASATGTNPTGNGTVTSVFVDFDNENNVYDINVNIKHIYSAKIASVTEASGNDARKVTVSAKTFPSSTIPSVTLDNDFETNEFKKDDIVLYTASISGNDATIQSMELATLVSGAEVTKTSTELDANTGAPKPNKSVVTAGGKDYKLNINVKAESKINANAIDAFDAGDKYDLYLDNNGYIVWAEKTEEELNLNNYLVLVRGGMSSGLGTNPVADAVTLTGTKLSDITISKYDGSSISGATPWNQLKLYTVYKYTVNGSNYELKPLLNTDKYNSVGGTDLTGISYTKGNAKMPGGVGNTATKLVVYDMKEDKVSNYTGVANFPKIDSTKYNGASVLDTKTNAANNLAAMTGYTGIVTTGNGASHGAYTALVKDGTVIAGVWVHNSTNANNILIESSVSAADIIYVTSKNYTTTTDSDKVDVYTFEVIKDGKVTTVSTKTGWIKELFANDQDLYQITEYDGDYVDKVNPRVSFNDSNGTQHAAAYTSDVKFNAVDTANAGVSGQSDSTRWGRVRFHKDANKFDVRTDGTTYTDAGGNTIAVYSVDADVTSGTFKLTLNNANSTNDLTYAAVATNANTKFFKITSSGKVDELKAENFDFTAVTKGEFSVIYDANDQVATYIFYQEV